MILAEKITDERKKNGWSQEELADKLGVSRQSVSKWESAQSVPDLQRILDMSKLFGVSTDYLLKDSEEARIDLSSDESDKGLRRVSMEEANSYLSFNRDFAAKMALGVTICTFCPVPLLTLLALQSGGILQMSEDMASGIGVALLLLVVAVSLIFIIPAGISASKWEWLENDPFDTEYGVDGMVRAKADKYQTKFVSSITIGTVTIMAGVIALIAGIALGRENDTVTKAGLAVLMAFVTAGVSFIVRAGITRDGFSKLLQEGDYSREKKSDSFMKTFSSVYWIFITAGFLAWSFIGNSWHISWIVWPIAGVVFGGLTIILNAARGKKQ